jgi:hypothetical protein
MAFTNRGRSVMLCYTIAKRFLVSATIAVLIVGVAVAVLLGHP